MTYDQMAQLTESISARIIQQEYGCDPFADPVIRLKAEIRDKVIYVFVVGKWRSIRYYGGKGIPGKKIQEDMKHSVRINTGWIKTELAQKPIEFIWE